MRNSQQASLILPNTVINRPTNPNEEIANIDASSSQLDGNKFTIQNNLVQDHRN
jgi:hypothetical protein